MCVCVCIPSGSYLPGTSEMFATPRPSHSRETSFRLKKNCGLPHLKESNPDNLEKKIERKNQVLQSWGFRTWGGGSWTPRLTE